MSETWATLTLGNLTLRIGLVDPTKALFEDMLTNKVPNRRRNPKKVAKHLAAMREKRWRVNGAAHIRGKSGLWLDGQHRAEAGSRASDEGVVLPPVLIVEGVEDDAFLTMDIGLKRTFKGHLDSQQEANATMLAALVAWVWRYRTGRLHLSGANEQPDIDESQAVLESEPKLRSAIPVGRRVYPLLPISLATFLFYVFSEKDAEQAEFFMDKLATGENLGRQSPIYLLRNRLIDSRRSKAKLRTVETLALCLKAWNAYRAGRELKNLAFRSGGAQAEDYPGID